RALQAELLERQARLYEERLGEEAKAVDAWKRLLDLDHDDRESAPQAADALLRLYEKANDPIALVAILRLKLGSAEEALAGRELLRRIAKLEEERARAATLAGQPAELQPAIATYHELYEVEPADPEVQLESLLALERLYQMQRNFVELREIYRRRVTLA